MKFDGYKLYESANGVILADEVPPKYITEHNPMQFSGRTVVWYTTNMSSILIIGSKIKT